MVHYGQRYIEGGTFHTTSG